MNRLNAGGSGSSEVRLKADATPICVRSVRLQPDIVSGVFLHQEQQSDRDRAGDDRQREQRAIVARIKEQERGGGQRADDRAGVIHGAMKTEDPPSRAVGGKRREHRVARRASNPLPDAIEQADRQHLRPRLGEGNQRPDRRRQRVADEHDRPLRARAVGQPAGGDLQDAVHRFRRALDHPERERPCTKHARQEKRKERVNGLGRRVGREADPSKQPNWSGE